MSAKKILGIGLAVVGVALMFTGVGAPLGSIALGAGLGSLSVATVIGAGLLVASNFLMGPTKPKGLATQASDRLTATLDLTTPRKIWFGHTAGATDVRYQAFTGSDQEYLEQIICVASHKVDAIEELWLDNEKAWTAAGGPQGRYVGFLTVTARLEGTSVNGIAIDSVWDASCTLTGCAYIHLKALLVHDDGQGGNDSPFAGGVTSRMTIRGKGALTYDPRLDSTVDGGAGAHRADDQTTWTWDDDASRNPVIQELWYELGWKINGKLAVGKGVPPARLDLAGYAVAANLCDEGVTKSAANGGGTEPRYRTDYVLSEGDDPGAVRDNFCVSMNALLRDAGGKLTLSVLHNDLATPAAPTGKTAFDEDDVKGTVGWSQTPDLSSSFNIVRGRYIDASDNALYQLVDFPEVSLTSPDGIDRIDPIDFQLVQSNGQAQRLAKQRLERNQYQGRLSFTGKPSFWGISVGDVFAFSHVAYGWSEKLFRCASQKINRWGATEIIAVEENAAIYAWDNDEAAAVTPGAPTVYDPTNTPLQRGMNSAAQTSVVIDPISDIIIKADSTGTPKAGELRPFALTASIGTQDVTTEGTWSRTVTAGITCTIGAATGIVDPTVLTAAEIYLPVTFTFGGVTRNAMVHIVRQDDAATTTGAAAGDTPSQSSGFTAISSTSFADISGSLFYTVPTGKTSLTVTVNLGARPQSGGADGSWTIEMKVQRKIAGVWTDQGATFSAGSSATTDGSSGFQSRIAAAISGTRQITGLSAGTQYELKLVGRVTTGPRTHDVSGIVSSAAP